MLSPPACALHCIQIVSIDEEINYFLQVSICVSYRCMQAFLFWMFHVEFLCILVKLLNIVSEVAELLFIRDLFNRLQSFFYDMSRFLTHTLAV